MKPAARSSEKKAKSDSENEPSEDDCMSDNDSVLSSTPPKKARKAPAASKKKASVPREDVENESVDVDDGDAPSNEKVEDQYQKVRFRILCCEL